MRNLPICLMLIFICLFFLITPAEARIHHRQETVEGVEVGVIRVDMNDKANKVTVILSRDFPGGPESFEAMIGRGRPAAAINGTFFCNQTYKPVGDIVIDGQIRNQGRFGTALAITPDNTVCFIKTPTGYGVDWSGYETVLACGPRLVRNGRAKVNARAEGFKDSHVLGSATRSAVGLTRDNQLLLVSTRKAVTLEKLAYIMVSLGCVDAINMDGGASTAIYYRDHVLISPGRPLTNIIAVYENTATRRKLGPVAIRNDAEAERSIQNAHIQFKKAMDYFRNARYREAEPFMSRACQLNPAAANYIKLAEIKSKLGIKQEAADAHAEAARIYYEKGMINAAVVHAKRALKLNPNHQNAKKYYNLSQKKRGKPRSSSHKRSSSDGGKRSSGFSSILKFMGILFLFGVIFFIGYRIGKAR